MSFATLEARGRAVGEKAARDVAERLAEQVNAGVPGVRAEVVPDGVAISGRGLSVRMLADPALRWFGEKLR